MGALVACCHAYLVEKEDLFCYHQVEIDVEQELGWGKGFGRHGYSFYFKLCHCRNHGLVG